MAEKEYDYGGAGSLEQRDADKRWQEEQRQYREQQREVVQLRRLIDEQAVAWATLSANFDAVVNPAEATDVSLRQVVDVRKVELVFDGHDLDRIRGYLKVCELVRDDRLREVRLRAEREAEEHRAEVIAVRRQTRESAPTEAMGRKCVACGKKPRSVDDYCKKCAREAGIVVRGKIGE